MVFGRRSALSLGICVLLAAARPAPAGPFADRWHAGDAAPDVEGVHLGDTLQQVLAALGQPDRSLVPGAAAGLQTLSYRHGALLIAIGADNAVSRMMLRSPEGGAIAGIRVGDGLGAMVRSWGEPTYSRGSLGKYQTESWTISVRADIGEQKVLKMMLARTPPPAPPPQPLPDPSAGPSATDNSASTDMSAPGPAAAPQFGTAQQTP